MSSQPQGFRKFRGPDSMNGLPANYLPIVNLEECHIDFQTHVPVAGLILQEEDIAGCGRELGLRKQPAFLCPTPLWQNTILTGHRVDPFGCILGFPREVSAHSLQREGAEDLGKGPLAEARALLAPSPQWATPKPGGWTW